MTAPANEHEFKATNTDDVFYPDHAPRTESATFRETKRYGKANGDTCAITGTADGIEYHHFLCEDALTNGVDWHAVKKIGTGELTTLPVIDPYTGAQLFDEHGTPRTYPAARSLVGMLTGLATLRGFDWHAFDPDRPETFVDSPANMLVLHEKYHRSSDAGIHHKTFPVWAFFAFPRVPGFIYTPDELARLHKAGA